MSNILDKGRTALLAALVALLALLPLPQTAAAVSLWTDTGSRNSLYVDHRAHAVGDILTIIINETSKATRSGSANNSKSTSTSMDAGTGIFHGLAAASASNSDSFKASGSIVNSNTVSGRLTVTVKEIKPNGNLVLSGMQSIKQNGEEQKITISGEVRPEDVTSDNTVYSSQVANAQIRIDGNGPLANKQRQGIITRLFDFLF